MTPRERLRERISQLAAEAEALEQQRDPLTRQLLEMDEARAAVAVEAGRIDKTVNRLRGRCVRIQMVIDQEFP